MTVGFLAGFYSYVPIRRQDIRFKETRSYRIEEQRLTEKYLNQAAPAIATKTADEEEWRLNNQKGKEVLVFFWATTCGYSQRAIPDMKAIYSKYGKREDFIMVGVALDKDRDTLACFSSVNKIPWLNLFEEGMGWDNGFSRAFAVHRIPSLWIIDKNGIIRGFNLSPVQAETILSALFDGREIDLNELGARKSRGKSGGNVQGCPG